MHEHGAALAQLLLEGNQDEAWEYINEYRKKGKDSLYIYEHIITAGMRHIGSLWETNKISVADEHLATSTCDFLLARYQMEKKKEQNPSNSKKAMFLCVESEQHYLGIKMASQLFSEAGWTTRFHGPNLPLEYAKKTAVDWQPDVICLSFSILYHAEHLNPYIAELEKLPNRPTVMIGGRLLSQYEFSRYGSKKTIFMKNLEDVRDWLKRHPPGVKSSVSY
ncbi:B12-binding domain-containing protein [Bacillus sp. FJAT-27251]|uniref:cobalamin B12-binding domain-containing protein n=1 Tax=Bacillus sp. FJAT-27251 TaxID=1684142 RepID=UPI0006A7C1BA|nr:B12-binding domain-containing protein [Bacillus sp. FJAT-27251]